MSRDIENSRFFIFRLKFEPVKEMVSEFHVGIPNQITAIGKIYEHDLKELEPLKYICSVRMSERLPGIQLREDEKTSRKDSAITKQNLSNKMNRDNFSTLEPVEIADALEMQLLLKNTSDEKEYIIDYPADQI